MTRSAPSYSAAWLASRTPDERAAFIASLNARELAFLIGDWRFWARPDQWPPAGDWTTWLLLGGRGAGKTRAGAEWVRAAVEGPTPLAAGTASRVALVSQSYGDARDVMVEGPSGLIAIAPRDMRPAHEPSRRRVVWPNGAVATYFSSDDPDGLRGPQFDAAWSDEFCKWTYVQETWDMLQFALRLGPRPRQAVTTTPRPIRPLKELLALPTTAVSRASTYANRAHLAPAFFAEVIRRYEGTRLGRQELDAELIEDNPNALWRRATLERARVAGAPDLIRIVVAVDPPAARGPAADACGIVVAGRSGDGVAYVLADRTVQGLSPQGWASHVAAAYHAFAADRVIAEVNQGGEMVRAVLTQVDPALPIETVHATRGKALRAEPVSALYEQGRVRHVGALPELEDAMCAFDPYDPSAEGSPDRVDALVWALTALMLARRVGNPRVRVV